MAALAITNILPSSKSTTEFAGDMKVAVIRVTPSTASDTVTLTAAANNIGTIVSVFPVIKTAPTTTFQSVHATFSGLVITLVTLNGAGGAATTWGDVDLLVFGY